MFRSAEAYVVTHSARARADPQLGAPHENVSFTTSDGLRLHGWFVPSKNGATVISFPGRKGPQKPACWSARAPLLFDRRGEGRATATRTPRLERHATWRRRSPTSRAGRRRPESHRRVGLSVGGEMMLQAAAETDDFEAVVSEGAGSARCGGSPHGRREDRRLLAVRPRHRNGRLHQRPAPAEPHRPQRRDHGAGALHPRDTRPGRRDADREVLRGGEGPEGVLGRSGRAHRAPDAAPEEYERRVVGFFDRHLLGSSS